MNLVDSCGWLEFFAGGGNASFFAEDLREPTRVLVPSICIYEVYRRLSVLHGRRAGWETTTLLRQGIVVPLTGEISRRAVEVSLEYRLSMADSMILATALATESTLWTQDAHFEHIPGVKYVKK